MVKPLWRLLNRLVGKVTHSQRAAFERQLDFSRADVDAKVTIFIEGRTFRGRLHDVSISGAVLEPNCGLNIGDELEMELPNIPGRVKAQVMRLLDDRIGVGSPARASVFSLRVGAGERLPRTPRRPLRLETDGAVMAETLDTIPPTGIGGRLKAWWDGGEAPDVQAEKKARLSAAVSASEDAMEEFPSPSGIAEWAPQRIASIQRLYGEGNDGPSSRDRIRYMVNPIGLNAEMTVLNIGARLGTAARTIAKETGAWVDGIEWDEGLVDEAVRLSAKEGLVKKSRHSEFEFG